MTSLADRNAMPDHPPLVLVHGAWLGGWIWRFVSPALRASGYPVHTPTLTGLGERSHLASPAVNLDTHIQDIVNLLHYEDLTNVTLVGHSYAGMVISGVADRVPERLAHLIYLDAFVPHDGQSMDDLVPPEDVKLNRAYADAEGGGYLLPLKFALNVGEPTERDLWASTRTTPQPLAANAQTVSLTNPHAASLRRTYIHALRKPERDLFAPYARHAATDPAWRLVTLDGDHMAMISRPETFTAALLAALAN